jgi:hypothetical protein
VLPAWEHASCVPGPWLADEPWGVCGGGAVMSGSNSDSESDAEMTVDPLWRWLQSKFSGSDSDLSEQVCWHPCGAL